jgi:lysophospholipase L1-like esterase
VDSFLRSRWDREAFKPQVAVIFLGTNDHSTEPVPTTEAFVSGYRALIAAAREGRGRLPILCLYPHERPVLTDRVKAIVEAEKAEGLPTEILALPAPADEELGCDWHPMAVVHARWAELVIPKLAEMMNWTVK